MEFGNFIRQAREELAAHDRLFTLRQVAGRLGVEPAYLSKIERGVFPPPSEEVILNLANILGQDKDLLMALAGKVSSDLKKVILKRPQLFAELLRQLQEAPDHAIIRLVREVKEGNW